MTSGQIKAHIELEIFLKDSSFTSLLLVAIGHRNPCDRSSVTSQEEERDVAGSGHQVDQHGHADSAQCRQVQLLNQQPSEENTQTGTGDSRHT